MRGTMLTLVAAAAVSAVGGALWFVTSAPAMQVEAAEPPGALAPDEALVSSTALEDVDAEKGDEHVRAPVEFGANTTAEPKVPAAHEEGDGAFDVLEEFRRARARGLVEDGELSTWLANVYLRHEDPRAALAALERGGSKDANVWFRVAMACSKAEDRAGKERALARAVELQPDNPTFLAGLTQLQPQRAITILELQLAKQPPPGDPGLRKRLARALEKGGRAAESKLLLADLLAENPQDGEALTLYGKVDPAGAAARLEALMAGAEDPAPWRTILARLYLQRGDVAAAQGLIENAERAGLTVAQEEWGQLGETLMAAGHTEGATSAWSRAMALEHGDPDLWVAALTEHAPGQLLSLLETRVASDERENDEYWGSLADAYWRSDRQLEAKQAWERARALDPADDEWPMRLEAIAAGNDPFE